MNIQIPQQPKAINPTTMLKLRDACKDNLRVRAMVEILFCGFTTNELFKIRLKDFSDNKKQITLRGKGGIPCNVSLRAVCVEWINEYLALRRNSSPYLFPGKSCGHISIRTLNHLIHELQISSGILRNIIPIIFRYTLIVNPCVERKVLHNNMFPAHVIPSFRRKFSDNIMKNMSIETISFWMRHCSIETSERFIRLDCDN